MLFPYAFPAILNHWFGADFVRKYEVSFRVLTHDNRCPYRIVLEDDGSILQGLAFCASRTDYGKLTRGKIIYVRGTESAYGLKMKSWGYAD
jgi:hypothetical protein